VRLTPPQLAHAANQGAGVVGCGAHVCYVCGGASTDEHTVARALSDTFGAQMRVARPDSPYVCESCVYVMSRTSPVIGRPAGVCKVCDGTLRVVRLPSAGKGSRSKVGDECPKCDGTGMQGAGGNFRNYSHLWEENWIAPPFGPEETSVREYVNASKGEKPLIRDFLRREHGGRWFAAIADMGQLHVLPFAPMNGRGRAGVVAFDSRMVDVPDDVSLLDTLTEALTAGMTKDELASGSYRQQSWLDLAEQIDAVEDAVSSLRGGDWFELALWLSQRDEEEHARRREGKKGAQKSARKPSSGDAANHPRRVREEPRRAPADGLLDAARDASPPVHDEQPQRERLADPAPAKSADRKPGQQLRLF
jgi:hypothetical protein